MEEIKISLKMTKGQIQRLKNILDGRNREKERVKDIAQQGKLDFGYQMAQIDIDLNTPIIEILQEGLKKADTKREAKASVKNSSKKQLELHH